jgi:Plasmid encoded RepA protein
LYSVSLVPGPDHEAIIRFGGEAPRRRAHSNERFDDHVQARVTTTSDRERPVGQDKSSLADRLLCAAALWYPKNDTQRVLWPSTLRLSLDYYVSLTRFAVPLDERAIAALAHSAMALDIYCWLAQRLHRIPTGQPQFVPWGAIYDATS